MEPEVNAATTGGAAREGPPEGTPAGPAGVPQEAPRGPLLDSIVEATHAARGPAGTALDQFLREPSPWKALALWLGRGGGQPDRLTKQHVGRRLNRDIARLDALLTRQINAILHHRGFQKLEASWRGLRYLTDQAAGAENVKVRVLNVTWKELARDLGRALEFDQSLMFHKVYEEEFGHPGGEPFGVLLGDYEVRHRVGPGHPTDDVTVLMNLSAVAAAAFAPFIAGAHPSLLDLGRFTELERPLNLPRTFLQPDYLKWRSFRHSEDARFVGLTLPRVLRRPPHADDGSRVDGLRFREEAAAPDRGEYLWGNAVYAFGAVLVRAFADSGWFTAIRGVLPDAAGGGLVTGLPVHCFRTDAPGLVPKCNTDAIITDVQEKELGDLGFIPLCHCQDTGLSAFYGNQSAQMPEQYSEPAATMNARLSAMLQHTLCVSRFAHYLKVIGRDRIGSFHGPADCEESLRRWLMKYTIGSDDADPEMRARHPLREARVQVRERLDRPGHYLCVIHLRPHFQPDQMTAAVKLVTELAPAQPG